MKVGKYKLIKKKSTKKIDKNDEVMIKILLITGRVYCRRKLKKGR